MAAILYDSPKSQPSIEGMMLVRFAIIRNGQSPYVELVYSEGAYAKNGTEPILNDLGNNRWDVFGKTVEIHCPLSNPRVIELMLQNAINPVELDDKLVATSNQLFNEFTTTPAAPAIPIPPVE